MRADYRDLHDLIGGTIQDQVTEQLLRVGAPVLPKPKWLRQQLRAAPAREPVRALQGLAAALTDPNWQWSARQGSAARGHSSCSSLVRSKAGREHKQQALSQRVCWCSGAQGPAAPEGGAPAAAHRHALARALPGSHTREGRWARQPQHCRGSGLPGGDGGAAHPGSQALDVGRLRVPSEQLWRSSRQTAG